MRTKTEKAETPLAGATPWPKRLYRTEAALDRDSARLHHVHLVRRTLGGHHACLFQPDAVFYVGNSPAAYLKDVGSKPFDEAEVREWHRFLWNQSVVPFLILTSKTQVRVYTAQARPAKPGDSRNIEAIISDTADALKLDQLLTEIESGSIYRRKPEAWGRRESVDHYLLRNLNATARRLASAQPDGETPENLDFAHRFLTRLLFVCYLLERGMIKGKHFNDPALSKLRPESDESNGYLLADMFREAQSPAKKRAALYRIFARVKTRFNGSLFSQSLTHEKRRVTDAFIKAVDQFLQGHEVESDQLRLGFWAYDFSVIPIEMISAIYEGFLGAQGEIQADDKIGNSRESSGAYYTPPHLAELTVDIALENVTAPIHEIKVLDPACGSGVFLVSLFGRMTESLRRLRKHARRTPSTAWARKVIRLLGNLHGIDVSATACHITCFSLYLAVLDQLTPMDVEELHKQGGKLPELLQTRVRRPDRTITCGNFFDPKLRLEVAEFDLVIGNPPWVSRRKQADAHFLAWDKQQPPARKTPGKQIAHGFMWQAPTYLAESGTGCLLLPVAVLLNQGTNRFQHQWFKSYEVDRVVDFSDLRHLLFKNAHHPCVAVRFGATEPCEGTIIRYEAPKAELRSQRAGPVYVREEDTSFVQLRELLNAATEGEAPVVWKSRLWGTWRDQRLLTRLHGMPKLMAYAGEAREQKRWLKGQGINKGDESVPGWWTGSTLCWPTPRQLPGLAAIPSDCPTVQESSFPRSAERPRDKKLFVGPKVLVSQGSWNMKVAFCDFMAVFKKSLQTITGDRTDADLLRFLCAAVKSDAAQYYLFHSSANWGTERDKALFTELLRVPFFPPEDAQDPSAARSIISEAADAIRGFEKELRTGRWKIGREEETRRLRRDILEPLVRQYYGIDEYEAMLIEDTLRLVIPSSTPDESAANIATLKRPGPEQCRDYAEVLCEMLNHFGTGSKFRVKGRVLLGNPYSVVKLSLATRAGRTVPIDEAGHELAAALKRLRPALDRPSGQFVFCQDLKIFDGDDLYALKPMYQRFWSKTAALNDADKIAGALLDSQGGR